MRIVHDSLVVLSVVPLLACCPMLATKQQVPAQPEAKATG
jgi:hypothetical protein